MKPLDIMPDELLSEALDEYDTLEAAFARIDYEKTMLDGQEAYVYYAPSDAYFIVPPHGDGHYYGIYTMPCGPVIIDETNKEPQFISSHMSAEACQVVIALIEFF